MAENRHKIPVSGYNPRTKELFFSWRESDAGGETAATPDRTLVYNLEYGHASYLDHGFTAMVNYQSYNQMSLRDFMLEVFAGVDDLSICDCDDSADDIIQGDPYVIGAASEVYGSLWNSQENTASSASATSLCTGLGTKGFEFFCEEGTEGSVFIMASAEDSCLKEYSEDYYKRDIYSSAGSGSYSSREYESVLESGALHFDTDNEKTLQRITLEYTGVTSDVVTASMKFGKANQPDLLLAGASYTDLTGVELLNYQSSAATSDIEANLISPDDKAYFNNYTRGRYLGYQLKLTGAGPATITRLTLSTRLSEK